MTAIKHLAQSVALLRKHVWNLQAASAELHHTDLIRLIASCGIIFSHTAEFMVPRELRQHIYHNLEGLTLFVDVFFVISGFVLSFVYAGRINRLHDFTKFMQRRIGRLVPLHLVTFLIVTALYLVAISLHIPINNQPSLSAKCLVSTALLIHAWNSCGVQVPNGVSWSISAEMAVYLLFPLFLRVFRAPRLFRIAFFGVLLGFCSWLSGGVSEMSSSFTALRAMPPFYFGVLIYSEKDHLRLPAYAGSLPFLLVGLLVIGTLRVWPRELLIVVGYSIAATAAIADISQIRSTIVSRLAPLGQLTYSAYMLHSIFMALIINALFDKWLKLGVVWLIIVTIATWLLIFIASLLSFYLFETPIRKKIDAFEFSFWLKRKHGRRNR